MKTQNEKNREPKKTRYIIIIGAEEEPGFAAAELTKGTTTVMITARTPDEASELWREAAE